MSPIRLWKFQKESLEGQNLSVSFSNYILLLDTSGPGHIYCNKECRQLPKAWFPLDHKGIGKLCDQNML